MPENYKFETFPFYKSIREWEKEKNYIMESSRWPLARHMVILICIGIASFALAFLGINICFFCFVFFIKFGNILCMSLF